MIRTYWVKRHERRYPSAAKPSWIVINDPSLHGRIKVLVTRKRWSEDLSAARLFLKRDAKRLLTDQFGEGWEELGTFFLVRP